MLGSDVGVRCWVYCDWRGINPPIYRLFVNDELFTERTWYWRDRFLIETMHICAVPGKYKIRYELLPNPLDLRVDADITVRDIKVVFGIAKISQDLTLEIV